MEINPGLPLSASASCVVVVVRKTLGGLKSPAADAVVSSAFGFDCGVCVYVRKSQTQSFCVCVVLLRRNHLFIHKRANSFLPTQQHMATINGFCAGVCFVCERKVQEPYLSPFTHTLRVGRDAALVSEPFLLLSCRRRCRCCCCCCCRRRDDELFMWVYHNMMHAGKVCA